MKVILLSLFLLMSWQGKSETFSTAQFSELLNQVSHGWNIGNARKAADAFTEDAVYIEPPDRQLYIGRDKLFEFFGGEQGRANPMEMIWHHVVFDESQQIGTAEYTFKYKGRSTHGIVIIKIKNDKISHWREYQYRSKTNWLDFIGKSAFQ